jgi:signal transduction histidine kinase/phage shock protein PspC (stress-responsive transcriptional regulator)
VPTPYEPAAAHPRPVTDGPDAGAGVASSAYQHDQRPARPPLVRSRGRGWTPGVCGAVARHLGVSRRSVRWVFVLLTLVGGAGLAAYVFLWALTPEGDIDSDPTQPSDDETPPERRQWVQVLAVGGVLVVLGAILLTPVLGGSVIGSVLVPLFTIAVGAIVAWSNLDDAQRSRWLGSGEGRYGWMRVALGAGLTVAGILVLVTRGESFSAVWDALLAAVAVLVGALIIAAPWALRLWGDLRREQVAAARATERADIAAHLHDSVLQTLALIQKQAGEDASGREVRRLARSQERELRAWLYGPPGGDTGHPAAATDATLAATLAAAAGEVEDDYGVRVAPVVVGDAPLDPDTAALVAAAREAMVNAAKHAGVDEIDVYAEVEPETVEIFVRDRGCGFDPDAVPDDRRGLAGSVKDRMARHGGKVQLRSTPGGGTEVGLVLPRARRGTPSTAPVSEEETR